MPFVCPEITCNLQWRNATRQLAYAKQGEYNSRKIAVQLYDGANRFTFTPGTYTGEFAYRRPDGAGRAYSTIDDAAAVELDGTTGTAVITLEPEVLGVAGIVECELRLKTSGSLLATFTFGYYVEQAVVTADTPSPSPDPGPTPTPTGEKTKFFGFETLQAYNSFIAQNPGVLVDGDIVVIKSVNGSDIVHTFYVLVGTQLTSRHVITVGSGSSGASSLPALGGGYGVCSSLKATVAKIVRIDGFVRTQNVPFQVKFNYDVQSGDTLNVRSSSSSSSGTGACPLRWNNDNVPTGLIVAGCTATLVYDGTYYQVLSVDPVTAPMIADGAITAEKVAAGVIPGWYYYASTSAYNTDAANVPNGSYVLIGTSQIILYRKANGSLSQICAWPTGGGGGNVDNVVIVPIENNQAQLTPYIIYNAGNNIMFYLYDQVTHALARLHKRPTSASDETATFIWEDTTNRQFVLYSLPAVMSTGITKSYVAFDQGGGGSGISKLTVTIRSSSGGYVSSHSPSEIAAAISNGDVVEVDCSGIMGWITGADANGAYALSIAVDGGTKSLEMWSINTNKSVMLLTQDIGDAYKPVTETLNGATPTISYAANNTIYKGGTLTSLTVNNMIPNGMFMLIFDSGSTPTNLGLPEYDAQHPNLPYVKKPSGFAIEANKHYELSINAVDGVGYLVGQGW